MNKTTSLVRLLEAPAKGLKTLEGQRTTCADVFWVWVSIGWHLDRILSDTDSYLFERREQIIGVYNARFELMMNNSPCAVHLLAFFLHPSTFPYHYHKIIYSLYWSVYRLHSTLQMILPPRPATAGRDWKPPRNQFPSLLRKIILSAVAVLHGEQKRAMELGGGGGKEEADLLVTELIRYAYGDAPFTPVEDSSTFDPLEYWQEMARDSGAQQLGVSAILITAGYKADAAILPLASCSENILGLVYGGT